MRVSSAKPMKNGGFLHRVAGETKPSTTSRFEPQPQMPERPIDAEKMIDEFAGKTSPVQIEAFARELGVTIDSLLCLGCCRSLSHHAWAFPMRDGASKIIGIRLRHDDGQKRSVKGSRSGLFIPSNLVSLLTNWK